ncbi:hypothetical protein ACFQ8K_04740 [Streptomyces erythrochromogenes]|uniref:hypothetical protein n=1 Tax=Streptomyces erythrochromogenes TaxID=285574 RepID=UPI0036CA1329
MVGARQQDDIPPPAAGAETGPGFDRTRVVTGLLIPVYAPTGAPAVSDGNARSGARRFRLEDPQLLLLTDDAQDEDRARPGRSTDEDSGTLAALSMSTGCPSNTRPRPACRRSP